MSRKIIFGKSDPAMDTILEVLAKYEKNHPKARIDIYRSNNVSIRIRIIDPDFAGMDLVERDTLVWNLIDQLPDEVASEITLLLLFTPKEAKKSFASIEFDNPVASTH
jgi:hypothetical protein